MTELTQDIVYDIACTPDKQTCFAARASGLYRSTDGGKTWEDAYASLNLPELLPTTSVVIAPDFDEEPTIVVGVPGGVLYSTDGGTTWHPVTFGSPPPAVSTLGISPDFLHDGIVIAGTLEDGVYRSANRGSNWVAWNFGLLDLNVFALALSPNFAADETIFAGVESGVFRSTNGGRAWREIELPIGYEPVLSLAVSPTYAQDTLLFAGTESQGLLKSTDRGKTWTHLHHESLDGPINGVVIDPDFANQPNILVMLESTMLISRDGGETWAECPDVPEGLSTLLAPNGLEVSATVLVGTADGDVKPVTLI